MPAIAPTKIREIKEEITDTQGIEMTEIDTQGIEMMEKEMTKKNSQHLVEMVVIKAVKKKTITKIGSVLKLAIDAVKMVILPETVQMKKKKEKVVIVGAEVEVEVEAEEEVEAGEAEVGEAVVVAAISATDVSKKVIRQKNALSIRSRKTVADLASRVLKTVTNAVGKVTSQSIAHTRPKRNEGGLNRQ